MMARICAAGGAALAATLCACSGPPRAQPQDIEAAAPASFDGLTDLSDDGSLMAGLHDPEPFVRKVAAHALGTVEAAEAVEALSGRITSEDDEDVLVELIFTLGRLGDGRVGEILASQLRGGSSRVRAAAAEALGRLGDDSHTSVLVLALTDAEPEVRGHAALALARLDGRRWAHPRAASEDVRVSRDQALARSATDDPSPEVRWRATYALAEIDTRPAPIEALRQGLDDTEPLVRAFALRGLQAHLEGAPAAEGVDLERVQTLLRDADPRVAVQAATLLGHLAHPLVLAGIGSGHPRPWPHVQAAALRALAERAEALGTPELALLEKTAQSDASPAVRREAWVALAALPDGDGALRRLALSDDPLDRAAAAEMLAKGERNDDWLRRLAEDPVAAVASVALEGLGEVRFVQDSALLERALHSGDTARVTGAAHAAGRLIAEGRARPSLVQTVAAVLPEHETFETFESAQALRAALGLGKAEPPPPSRPPPAGRLLARLVAEQRAALTDPRPRVRLVTDRGEIELELFRPEAPRHVASFLRLAEQGFYDGLDFHRVVANFVVQGLDPRGDGWGMGGIRLPDEIGALHHETGTVGTPNAGEPHTDGCQIFITQLPTPHLDARYTIFGRVVDGMDTVLRLEVGDVVQRVERRPTPDGVGSHGSR